MEKKNAGKTPIERLLIRLHVGAVTLQGKPLCYIALLAYLVLIVIFGPPHNGAAPEDAFTALAISIHRTLYPLYAIAGLLALIVLFGYPFGASKASKALARAGIVNSAGEAPMLRTLVEELRRRMILLKLHCVNNIDRCNTVTDQHLPRILIAFDEIAEALDKTGADKPRKEHIAQVEQCLATLSRLGRACGIHLIIGVQRPDVNAVPAQIKTNLSYRCCSRADNVLSMIALDNTSAADQIPKDSRGRFIDNEGRVFQAYYIKEEEPTYA